MIKETTTIPELEYYTCIKITKSTMKPDGEKEDK